jgi:hypothetical protein
MRPDVVRRMKRTAEQKRAEKKDTTAQTEREQEVDDEPR